MATQRSSKRLSALMKSRKFRDLARQESRRLHLEQLEDRRVMAVFVLPNNGELLNNGDTRTIAPQDLTFRFTDIPGLDPTTIESGIRLTRAGGDGQFGQANDVVITPGFIGLGDNNREVIMRFAETLPDDTYQITIFGAGTTPLRDSNGNPINSGVNQTLNFRLDLGAQVVSVVPQPVRRLANGSLAMNEVNPANPATTRSTQNMIYVYFNDDKLDPASATNREFYRLYVTRNTLDPSDDTEVTPTSVEYDQANNLVRLIFGQVASLDQFAPFNPNSGIKDPIGAFRLRIGTNESLRNGGAATVTQRLGAADPGSSFATAHDLGSSITAGAQGATVALAQAIEAQAYNLQWPGAINEPGHRDIPRESHFLAGADTVDGISTIYYNFQHVIGTIPDGSGGTQVATNQITENQKQRAREIFELYTRYSGVQFIESANSGLTIATGDMRVLNPTIPTGPGGVAGLAGGGIAIMDDGEVWNDSYGGNWFTVAMHEIGHLLGLGHTYDLPEITIQGDDGRLNPVGPEPVFPGDHDIAHMRHMYRPESKDIDMYRFTLDGTGVLTLETFAERLPNASSLDTALRLYRVGAGGVIEEIARNDDYFSKDSKIELTLGPGTYFVGVTASGNDQYDPTIVDSGMGGTTQGAYELKLDFRKSATQSIVDRTLATGIIPDTLNVPFDGDGDGTPGGVYNFWFRAAPLTIATPNPAVRARTIFVDKAAPNGGNGLISAPFNNIQTALAAAQAFDIVRIVGNGGADGNLATLGDNLAYQIGFGGASGSTPLVDGTELAVPKDVTVMIDAGAIFQMRRSHISVGSTAPSLFSDRSGGALQVLGTPNMSVYFTSYNEVGPNSVGLDQNPLNVPPAAGDWGGLYFKNDLDIADGRFDHEAAGIFLNYVNHADIRYGGGQVNVDSVSQVVTPINILDRRPTITFNTIRNSANAAMSANPDSFEETNFQEPQYWPSFSSLATYNPSGIAAATPSASFTLDYDRVGPQIQRNRLINNSTNALFVRTRTPAGNVLEELTVPGRFDDTDIVHVLEENLVVRGAPGGVTFEQVPPPVELVFVSPAPGQGNFPAGTQAQYKLTYVDALGNESLASETFFASTVVANSGIFLQQLPEVPTGEYVARKLYRRTSSNQPFTLVDQVPASVTEYLDRNRPTSGVQQQLRVLAVDSAAGAITRARPDASLVIDPSIIIKSDGARIDVGVGASLIAEGFAGREIIFTSLADDRYGAGSTFDTNNDSPRLPAVPVVATLNQGSASQNERQTVTLSGNPTGGAFTLTFNGQTTASIAHNATAAMLQIALEGLANIAPGDVAVTLANGVYTVTFQGTYANQNVPQMTAALARTGSLPEAGDWGGIFFSPDSQGSIDNAVFAFAGGLNRIEGTFTGFNAIEIHQADVRVTQSKFEFNADGTGGQAPAGRFGRGFNAEGTIFVRGAQPVIMDNIVINNVGAFININLNALNYERVTDAGRQSGLIEREPGRLDNNGPLVLRNRLRDNTLNGMVVRGGTLTTEGVWDDTDIVHILFDAVTIVDFHTFGGLRLESSSTQSLVVKAFGENAGFTATGRPLEIDDRIGGMLHILGQPGAPVILTSLVDDSAGAGTTPEGFPQVDTNGDGTTGQPGSGVPTFPPATGPLTVTPNGDGAELVDGMLFRPLPAGVTISNESYVGAADAAGTYINGDAVPLGILPRGIILTTGAAEVPTSNTDFGFTVDHDLPGDADLSGLIGGTPTFDAAILEFTVDVTSTSGIMSGAIDFHFGSEEFDEFVGSPFNDVLGVFVNGVNYIRDSAGNLVSINSAFFNIDNLGGALNIEYDGLTAGLTVTFPLQVGTNVIKIAIADASDPILDSGALLTDLRFSTQPVGGGVSAIPQPGDWRGVTIDQWAHDRNVETILEQEAGDGSVNSIPGRAQFLGAIGPFEKGGDENLRLGFTVHGMIVNPADIDVYSFQGRSGTEVWIELDRTTHALDAVIELIDINGNVLARSDNSPAEAAGTESRGGLARAMQKTPPYEGEDFYTTNPRDAGMRVILPGPTNTTNTYYVRVRSSTGTVSVTGVQDGGSLAATEVVKGINAPPSALVDVIQEGGFAQNEIQVAVALSTTQPFTLNFGGQTTAPISPSATAAQVQSALAALSSIGPGNVLVVQPLLGAPVWEIEFVGAFANQNVPLMTSGGSRNEVQQIALPGGVSAGTFTLTFAGQTTTPLAANANAAAVQAALVALSNIGPGDVVVTGGAGGPWTVTFGGAYANQDVPAITTRFNEVQRVGVGGATGGSFTLTFNGQTTAPISPTASAATVQAALEALPSIGAGNVLVTGGGVAPWQVEFRQALAGQNVSLLVANSIGLTGGQTSGAYQLQLRLREVDEFGGSTVRFTKIAHAVNGIHVIGQPTHSPLTGEAFETTGANQFRNEAQFVGNLLNTDRGVLSIGGAMSGAGDIDWYEFTIQYDATQGIAGVSDGEDWWSTIFDIDYADGLARPNLIINVFNSLGQLVLSSKDSNIADDRTTPFAPSDVSNLSRGSSGAADPWIGNVELPQGTYYVAISSDNQMPALFDQFTNPATANPFVRLEPMNSVRRIVEDRRGGPTTTGTPPVVENFITPQSAVPWSLHDVTMYVSRDLSGSPNFAANQTQVVVVDPFSGIAEYTLGSFGRDVSDIVMHPNGSLFTYTIRADTGNNARFSDAQTGNYLQIDTGTGAATQIGDDGIETYMQDPGNANPAAVRANDIGNNNRVGEGIHFRAMEIASFPGNPFNGGIAGLAIGGRDPLLANGSDAPNILYVFDPNTGAASGVTSPNRSGTGLLPGLNNLAPAGTQIVERAVLNTAVDAVPSGPANLLQVLQEATFVDPATGATTFQIMDNYPPTGRPPEIPFTNPDPTTFSITYGGVPTIFEFDAGPEAIFQINPNSLSGFISDGQGFLINGTTLVEFDTGEVISVQTGAVGGSFADGTTLTIVSPDANGGADTTTTIFEFDNNNTTTPGNIPISTVGRNTNTLMAQAIRDAINSQGLTTVASIVPGTTRVTLANNVAAFPGINPLDDTDVDHSTQGMVIVGAAGVAANSIQVRIEETSVHAELAPAFALVNAMGNLPLNTQVGVNGAVGVGRMQLGFDGNRLNISGATTIVNAGGAAALRTGVFLSAGSQGGIIALPPGRVAVPFLAEDTASDLATRMAAAINAQFNPPAPAFAQGDSVVAPNGSFTAADPPLQAAAQAPGGTITGMTAVQDFDDDGNVISTDVFVVTDLGGLYRLVGNPFGTGVQLDYINSATELVGIQFSGLDVGPAGVEGQRYREMMFATTSNGMLYAFNQQGILQPIFNSRYNPVTQQMEAQSSMQLQSAAGVPLTNVHGVAFSTLDNNLWGGGGQRNPGDDPGHGIYPTVDDSRPRVTGGSTVRFGGYNRPGGAHGTIESAPFSLAGYSAADLPTFYFNYFIETEGVSSAPGAPNNVMRDALRVFVGGDDGVWHMLTTNNSYRSDGDFDEFDYAPARIQNTFDVNEGGAPVAWRQARISLAEFAGQDNLRIRFDFSTAGSLNIGDQSTATVGDELRAVAGIYLRDGQNFTLSAGGDPVNPTRTFAFDLGYTLVAPNGVRIPDGAQFTVDGITYEFDLNGTATPGTVRIAYQTGENPEQIAQRIALALAVGNPSLPVNVNGNRVNLKGFDPDNPGAFLQATNVTATNIPAGFIEGAPGVAGGTTLVNVHSGMTREQVREAIAVAMAGVYAGGDRGQIKTHNEMVRLIGNNLGAAGPAYGYRWIGQQAGPNSDPLNQRLLGVTLELPGDEFGAFNSNQRAQNNTHEGIYLDDFIIGFAERGEMVSGLDLGNDGFIANPNAQVETNIVTGAYQLEIRRGAEAGIPTGSDTLPRLALLPSIDTNDRLATGRTLVAPPGYQLADGQFFTLSDGVNQVTFEFNDTGIPGSGVTQGRIRIDYTIRDPDYLIAQRIRAAIHSAPVQSVLRISAGLSDGVSGSGSTSNLLNLYGTISITNGGLAPGAVPLAPPLLAETAPSTLIDNDVAVNTVGHFRLQLDPGGGVGTGFSSSVGFFPNDIGMTVQGATQTLVDQNLIFSYLNLIDLGDGSQAFGLLETNLTQFPTAAGTDAVQTAGNFQGPNGLVNWTVRTEIPSGSFTAVSTITFTSALPLGNFRVINYLDQDILAADDDLLYQVGQPGDANFRVFALDGSERIGLGQGGVYTPGPGLVNARYDGWASDVAFNLLLNVAFGNQAFSPLGVVNTATLPPLLDERLGMVHGQGDVTSAMAWSVNPEATTATVTTFLELMPVSPLGSLTFRTYDEQYGDRNLFRDQGQIILHGNEISHSLEWGILVDAAPRDPADGSRPHPGSVRNLPELNTQRLAPGVVIVNNTIYGNGNGGIRFSGDPANDAAVPFGRIVNNTLYGQGGAFGSTGINDVGIQVDQNAAPTILNNLVVNFTTGVGVDASSQGAQRTVLGGMLYQANSANSPNIGVGSSAMVVPNSQRLFVNPAVGNFYPAFGSPAIDSSVDSLLDRPALVTVRNPLGIPQSPILSPDRDGFGQLRVDDPSVNTPQGVGLNPFKDRGAIDRVDFIGPTSVLINPPDNDAEGTDLDPAPTTVVRANDILREFRIQLIDRFDINAPPEGSDLDDLTVSAASVVLEVLDGPNAGVQVLGTHYFFAYDATNNTIILTPAGGVWPLNQTYRIRLDNSAAGIRDRAGNPLLPNQPDGSSHFYTIFVGSAVDWGDAPASYGVLAADNGPSHTINAGVRLGASVGAEADGQPSATANADLGDDGLVSYALLRGADSFLTIVASAPGFMHVWVDLDNSGTFDEDEYLVQGVLFTTPGAAQVFNVGQLPDGPQGTSFMRIRFTTDTIDSPLGHASDGEVEDYQIQIGGPAYHNGNPNTVPADVDNNGVVNILDLLHVVNFLTYLQSKLITPGSPLTLPPTSPPYRADDMPNFDPTGGGVPGAARYIDVSDVNPTGNGYGQINLFDLLAVVNYIVANFDPGDGEGEASPLVDGPEGEASPSFAPATLAAASSTTSSTASSDSRTSDSSRYESAALYAAGNITLEVRERTTASPLAATDWKVDDGDDDLVALMAVGQAAHADTDEDSLTLDRHLHRSSPMGPLDADIWESLLAELAQDVGGLPDDDFLS